MRSLLLSPGPWYAQGSVCALPESVSPVLCKFWQLCGGLMATSSKRAYAIPRATAPRAPAPAAAHCRPAPPQRTPKHILFQSLWGLGPGVHKVCLSPLSVSDGYGVLFKTRFCASYHLAGPSPLPLKVGCLFKVAPAPRSHCSSAVQPPLQCHTGVDIIVNKRV